MRRAAILVAAFALAGCVTTGAHTVAVDVQPVDKPVPVGCRIDWPKLPTPHVANLQLSGDDRVDLPRIWRAAEAELEELRAYRLRLDAAAKACVEAR